MRDTRRGRRTELSSETKRAEKEVPDEKGRKEAEKPQLSLTSTYVGIKIVTTAAINLLTSIDLS
ncbi:hypothetical protein E2C01_063490 [Portunus trituberculatus]|uniref:Uncharacterized protein n=1 Tax=Portunus trituberculatus TaxID=210409 RepID=A0A5B7HDT8_PORTR|nr:hypothetical protein [Portunus trituberculatus]